MFSPLNRVTNFLGYTFEAVVVDDRYVEHLVILAYSESLVPLQSYLSLVYYDSLVTLRLVSDWVPVEGVEKMHELADEILGPVTFPHIRYQIVSGNRHLAICEVFVRDKCCLQGGNGAGGYRRERGADPG